jgi:hypothetical protein
MNNMVSMTIVIERGEPDTNHKIQYPVYFISEVLSDYKTRYFSYHEARLCTVNHILQAFPLFLGTPD